MRFSTSTISCIVMLLSICSGCDVTTSNHSPQPIRVSQTEPSLSLSPTLDTSESNHSGSSSNKLFTLVSNNASKKNRPTQTTEQPHSPEPDTQPADAKHDSTISNSGSPSTGDQTHADPTLTPQEKFRPPFTERTNVFTPPNSDQSVPTNEGETSIAIAPVLDVTLKGFARVDDLKAILMIEDTIAPLGMGQEKQGIRIISIEPPKVTLERDDQRWSLTLSNQFSPSGNARSRRLDRD